MDLGSRSKQRASSLAALTVLLSTILCADPARAQVAGATLSGRSFDGTAAVIPSAH
jgi:hypothetical protein